ncbi:SOS response-associated peptidase [Actinoalloteichus sp. AHMU CJ021]|uniref:Abasic site processing protein n=1 Tax=Actinoalloteichus caeruleus DSM 43889 TaxID=1120930 RepID=A0ABT1JMI1_ACTCY|nr:SOS response-associated peptidase [Actinoalloteichus caeruleus]AUS79425.1 SOS response-associated peptidase [Actinoalloteichus sp. AHMU CJ021]MCP2333735.1 putative SOS response-associated peptidase YedK [Actinoalloteichus caeruleus DSM 43889]
MCGRYASTRKPAQLAREFDAVDVTGGDAPGPDYNIQPTHPVLVITGDHPNEWNRSVGGHRAGRIVRVMTWGLVPRWAKDPAIGSRMFAARVETVADKPAFRDAAAARRCLLPADGWYEWVRGPGRKYPFYSTRYDGSALAIAGIWSSWSDPEPGSTRRLDTCAVLTTPAVGPLAAIGERMPLLLPPSAWDRWLDTTADVDTVSDLMVPPPAAELTAIEVRPVSREVNRAQHHGPRLTRRFDWTSVTPDLDTSALLRQG